MLLCVNLVPQEGLVESNSSDMASAARCLGRNTLGRQEEMGWWTNFFS